MAGARHDTMRDSGALGLQGGGELAGLLTGDVAVLVALLQVERR